MKVTTLALTALVALAPFAVPEPARADFSFGISINAYHSFHAPLAPHGSWFAHAEYGNVWRPQRVARTWRPYTDGYWANTDHGWAFVSDEPWAWATYHYGRWYLDHRHGWVWIPHDEWAPSWVAFYEHDGYIGWAPLGPRTTFRVGFTFDPHYDHRSFSWVERRHFLDRRLRDRLTPVDRNDRFVRGARSVARFDRVGTSWATRGPSIERISRDIGREVPRHRVRDFSNLRREVPRISDQDRARFDRDDRASRGERRLPPVTRQKPSGEVPRLGDRSDRDDIVGRPVVRRGEPDRTDRRDRVVTRDRQVPTEARRGTVQSPPTNRDWREKPRVNDVPRVARPPVARREEPRIDQRDRRRQEAAPPAVRRDQRGDRNRVERDEADERSNRRADKDDKPQGKPKPRQRPPG